MLKDNTENPIPLVNAQIALEMLNHLDHHPRLKALLLDQLVQQCNLVHLIEIPQLIILIIYLHCVLCLTQLFHHLKQVD